MHEISRLQRLVWAAAAVCLSAAAAAPLAAQPAFRVADLNVDSPTSAVQDPESTALVEHAGDLYFRASDGLHGIELWRAEGAGGSAPELMADICPGACSSCPGDATPVGAALFFSADDGAHGRELWVSDADGTRMVADLVPGLAGSLPINLVAFGGRVLFSATDPVRSHELWVSDGTAAGTQLLLEINPGSAPSSPVPLAVLGSRLLFAANDGVHGQELWTTDGTAEGTALVMDICPGLGAGVGAATTLPHAPVAAVAGDRLFLLADDCTHGAELWVSDGTAANTHQVEDIFPGLSGGSPDDLTPVGTRVFFSALEVTHGQELWVSDGTEAGTHLVADVWPFNGHSSPLEITAFGGKVYFHADDGVHGRELWVSDGTPEGTSLVADIRPAGDGFRLFRLQGLAAVGSRLVFFAEDGIHGNEPWASDGTPAGTVPLGDFRPGFESLYSWSSLQQPEHHAVVGDRLFFRAGGPLEVEIWSTDGTAAGTAQEPEINIQTSAFAVSPFGRLEGGRPLAALGGRVLFPASDGSPGLAFWASDGSPAGTVQLADAAALQSRETPQAITALGDAALFTTDHGLDGSALWRTDGTPAGTFPLAEFFTPFAFPSWLTRLGDRVLFTQDGELWTSDGTADGTATVVPLGGPTFPAGLKPFPAAGKVLFRAAGEFAGHELWATDGTAAGTQLVKDLRPGAENSLPNSITAIGPLALFSADVPATGRELWATDGTEAGTRLVADIRPGVAPSLRALNDLPDTGIDRVAAAGSVLFFAAHRLVTGEELWKSDGTAAGTAMVRDIIPGPGSPEIQWLTAAGAGGGIGDQRVYFVADDGIHGRELWTSDGTAEGTRLVEDILPGSGSSLPGELTLVDGLLLFSAHDGAHGVELWKSNGTAAGTFRVQDIAPGPLPSTPLAFTPVGTNVYFTANDAATGFELWALPRASLSRFGDVPPGHWAWPFVEALAAAGLTSGCGNGNFCPGAQVSRAQMAVFLVSAVHGPGFTPPPATGTRFTDVPAGAFAAAHIEQLASDGVTGGCSLTPPRYCPASLVSRAQMAVFLLVAKHGAGFTPPAGTGAVFTDVGPAHWARDWIEQLAAEGITGGCGGGKFCPDNLVTRAEMAVLLTTAFDLLP